MAIRKHARSGGILLHPTSLPTEYGIGDLGPAAHHWIEWLNESGCKLWQVLPLGPTGYGDSPYQSFSSFAGNPMLISIDVLMREGLLSSADLEPLPEFPADRVSYRDVIPLKRRLLGVAFQRFADGETVKLIDEFHAFRKENESWLMDYALFMALKGAHGGAAWTSWEPALVKRRPKALREAERRLDSEIERVCFQQFIFFRQWARVRAKANELGIKLIGDVPIFVAHDSADVWVNPHLFILDEAGIPTVVSGVPPDYFSATGQRWGNPIYRWDHMEADGFKWWVQRFRAVLSLVDFVRLDHFRGFEAYWEIPAEYPTAEKGRWVPAPGEKLLELLRKELGELPIIAEDLGVITPEVESLRDGFDLPGMRILQFAFEGKPDDEFLPHNYPRRTVVYTGTHDNDTSKGWYEAAPETVQDFCRRYLASDGNHIAWDMIRAIWGSVAELAVAPMQDFLELGSEARMNFPGRAEGNWNWRMQEAHLTPELAASVRELNFLYDRLPKNDFKSQ
ncbi:MAG: 4-alpha-glucanotransferase [Anaerolineales bacterium]|nr:4-alpha-glucanotransferase [Anaerolineales bacterium]